MRLNTLLSEKRKAILDRWYDLIIESYPADTAQFLKRQKDRFANPVGSTISQGMEGIFQEIITQNVSTDTVSSFLDNIVRIRAVQDFTPSKALSFIFLLKKVIREELDKEPRESIASDEMLTLDNTIDEMALISFDIYMQCREKIYEIKANEVKNMTFRLLQRAQLLTEKQEPESQEYNFLNINKTKGGN